MGNLTDDMFLNDSMESMDSMTMANRSSSVFYSCFDGKLNGTHVTPERWQTPDKASGLATGTILLLFMAIGVPFNLLVIFCMLWKKLYRQPAHILLLNLAIDDLLMCVIYLPINITSALAGEFVFGSNDVVRCHVCQIGVIFVIFAHFNFLVLALLAMDRFIFIRFPLDYNRVVTVKTTLVVVICTWIFSILISVPPLYKFGEIRYTWSISTCSLYLLGNTSLTENIYYEVFSILVSFTIPIPILVVTNVWVVCIVFKQLNKLYKTKSSMEKDGRGEKYDSDIKKKVSQTRNKKQLRIVKIYGFILLIHIVTWVPNVLNISVIFALLQKYFVIPHFFFVINYLLFLSQVVLHPVMQAWLIPDIRSLIFIFSPCKRKKEKDPLKMESEGCCSKRHGCGCCVLVGAAMLPSGGFSFARPSTKIFRNSSSTAFSPTSIQSCQKLPV